MTIGAPDEDCGDPWPFDRLVAADAALRPPDPDLLTDSIMRRLVALGLVADAPADGKP